MELDPLPTSTVLDAVRPLITFNQMTSDHSALTPNSSNLTDAQIDGSAVPNIVLASTQSGSTWDTYIISFLFIIVIFFHSSNTIEKMSFKWNEFDMLHFKILIFHANDTP